MHAVLLLAVLALDRAAGPLPGADAQCSFERAAIGSTTTDAVREAPLKQQIWFNSSDAPTLLISAAVPADCACRLGARGLHFDSALPDAEVVWTQLLAINVVSEIASVRESLMDVDCTAISEAAQRCRAQPEQLHLVNVAGIVAGSEGAAHTTGSSVIEAAVQVVAVPATDEAAGRKDSKSTGVQNSAATVAECSGGWTAKWAARASLLLVTIRLTFATRL